MNFDLFAEDAALSTVRMPNPIGFNSSDSYDDKVNASVAAIKQQLVKKHVIFSTSFGKDSSALNVIGLEAIRQLQADGVEYKKAFFITVNTLVENPEIDRYVLTEAQKLRRYLKQHSINAEMRIATPSNSNNYLLNIVGGRMLISMPDAGRKCTSMMKVSPIHQLKRKLVRELGYSVKNGRDNFVNMTGMRFSESAVRGRNMEARQERADAPVKVVQSKTKNDYEWMMAPLAYWDLDNIYELAGECTSQLRQSYSDLNKMIEIYRDANGGECLINIQNEKLSGKTACGSRFGCWTCTQVGDDKSMTAMLDNNDKYDYMRPLNHLRNLMKANHYDPRNRNYISRSINTTDGTIRIAPNSYSPEYCAQLLRWMLTIQIREEELAWAKGITPRFGIFSQENIIGIDFMWQRYGYSSGLEACSIWRDIYEYGERYDMPDIPQGMPTHLEAFPKVDVPFVDQYFGSFVNGAFDLAYAQTGMDTAQTIEFEDCFTIDEESAEYFFQFELDDAIERYGESNYNPTAVVHFLFRFGVLKIAKGKEHMLEITLQMANQLWRHGLRDCLNNPKELIRRLSRDSPALPSKNQQFDIEDCIRLGNITDQKAA